MSRCGAPGGTAPSCARGSAPRRLSQRAEHRGAGKRPAAPRRRHRCQRGRTTQRPTCPSGHLPHAFACHERTHTDTHPASGSVSGSGASSEWRFVEFVAQPGCLLSVAFTDPGLIWGKPQTYKARSCDAAHCIKVTEQTYPFMRGLALTPDTRDQILTFYNFFSYSSSEQFLSDTSSKSWQRFYLQASPKQSYVLKSHMAKAALIFRLKIRPKKPIFSILEK